MGTKNNLIERQKYIHKQEDIYTKFSIQFWSHNKKKERRLYVGKTMKIQSPFIKF